MSSGRLLWDARPGGPQRDVNEVAKRGDPRFAAVKALLPARGVVGYIGEPGEGAKGDYYLAQYALAPLVVDDSTNHRFVVGNFRSAAAVPSGSENPQLVKLQLVKDFGDGVFLFTNRDAS